MSAYLEALEAHNEASGDNSGSKLDRIAADRLARFNAAHGVH